MSRRNQWGSALSAAGGDWRRALCSTCHCRARKKVGTNWKSDQRVPPLAPTTATAYTNAALRRSDIVQLITKEAREIQLFINTTFERKHVSLLLCRLRWMETVNQAVVGSASIAERRVTPCSFIVGQLCPINNVTKDELYAVINSVRPGLALATHTLLVRNYS